MFEWIDRLYQFVEIMKSIIDRLKGIADWLSKPLIIIPSHLLIFFILAIIFTVGYGLSNLGRSVCKILMVVFWCLFFLFLVTDIF
jgi:hypothetical protein